MKLYFKLIRPHQWVKNAFVLTPLIFSENLLSIVLLLKSIIAFGTFCLFSSAVYIINDIFDSEEDRRHPVKKHRPLASGVISIKHAAIIAGSLFFVSLVVSFMLRPLYGITAVSYFVLNLLYTVKLKKLVILDVFCIAAGFVLRVVGGTVAIQVVLSEWLLLCTGLLALLLGFAKRRHELIYLKEEATNHRRVLSEYNPYYLDQIILVITAATVVVYTLFTINAETVAKFGHGLIGTVPFVLYGIFRYQYLVYHKGDKGNPTDNLLSDKPLLISILLWSLTAILIIYFGGK